MATGGQACIGVAQLQAVQTPLGRATGLAYRQTVDGLDRQLAELVASQLEVIDLDVERRHAAGRLFKQADHRVADPIGIRRLQRQARKARLDASGSANASGFTVFDAAGSLVGHALNPPALFAWLDQSLQVQRHTAEPAPASVQFGGLELHAVRHPPPRVGVQRRIAWPGLRAPSVEVESRQRQHGPAPRHQFG